MAVVLNEGIDVYRVRSAIAILKYWINNGTITNTTVAGDNTVQDFKDTIVNATVHESEKEMKAPMYESIVEMAGYGVISDALLAGLTTTAGLLALYTDCDPEGDV